MNVVERIVEFNRGRDPQRLAMKYRAMRASPFAFMRGTCHLFYDRLPKSTTFKSAPAVWSCGDLHLENFGSFKGDDGVVYFDINDFDEAALLPATVDLLRLMTSIAVLRHQGAEIGNASVNVLLETLLQEYRRTISNGKALWLAPETSQGKIRDLLIQVSNRKRVDFLDRRTRVVRGKRRLKHDPTRFLPVSDEEQRQVRNCIAAFASHYPDPSFFKVLDVARRIAGTGSLGLERYAILVEGHGSPDRNYLLDLKAAASSTAACRWPGLQPAWDSESERICTVQYRMQAVCIAFLHPLIWDGKPYVLRALQPSEDRLSLTGSALSADALMGIVAALGQSIASAQLRSSGRSGSAIADSLIFFAGKRKWSGKLLAFAHDMAAQINADWITYCAAFDRGAFDA